MNKSGFQKMLPWLVVAGALVVLSLSVGKYNDAKAKAEAAGDVPAKAAALQAAREAEAKEAKN